jgi:hypothetical protein
MANKVSITFEIDQDAKGRATLRQIDKGVDDIGKTAKQSSSDVDKFINGFKAVLVLEFFKQGTSAAISFGQAAVQAFNEAEAARKGLETVSKSVGIDPQSATEAVKNLELVRKGILTTTEASAGLKNLLRTGFSLEQSIDLLKRFADTATFNKQAHLSLGQAVVTTTEGIRQNTSANSDAGGISTNLSIIQERAKIKFDDLADATKRTASATRYYNEFLKETDPFLGDAAKGAEGLKGKLTALAAQQQILLETAGELISKNPGLAKSFQSISDTLEYLTNQLKDSQSGLSKFVNTTVSDFGTVIAITAKLAREIGILASAYQKFKQLTLLGVAGAIGFNTGTPDTLNVGDTKKLSDEASKAAAEIEKRFGSLRSKSIIDLDSLKQGQKYTDEINKSNEAYFKKTDEANKKFADGIREIGKATDDLQSKLSINPVAEAFLAADKSRIAFIEKLRDVPKEFRDAFTQASREVQILDLFKGVLGQSQGLSNLRLQRAQLEANKDPVKLAQAQRDAIQEQIDSAKKFLDIAQNPAQRQLALGRILEATSNTQDLNPEQRDARFKALNEQITVQEQLFRENFERLRDQTNAQKDNTSALVEVGNRLSSVEGALTNFAQGALTIKIENDSVASVDLGSVNGTTPLQSGSNLSNNQ